MGEVLFKSGVVFARIGYSTQATIFCHTWNDKSAADLFLSSRTTGLTGMAGLLAAEVADVLTGLTEAEFTGVCHGLALDLSLVPLPVEVWGENMGCLA